MMRARHGRGVRIWACALLACLAGSALLRATPPNPSAATARGAHLAALLGCKSCHGAALDGHRIIDDPTIGTLWSANLTQAVPHYSDAQLRRVIQGGVRPDGSHLWMMAAAPYAVLTDADTKALIAYLRSLPPTGETHPRVKMGPRFVRAVKAGRLHPEGLDVAAALAHPAPDLGARHARGRYLARTACGGCHMPDLTGVKDPQPGDAPDLIIAAAYDRDQFRTLMRTGKGMDDRDLGDMREAARERFVHLSDADIEAIRAYLAARAAH